MLKKLDVSALSLDQLRAIESEVETFLFKQQGNYGEPWHPLYKKNRKLFKKLISQEVEFKRSLMRFFKDQSARAYRLVNLHLVKFDEASDLLNDDEWDDDVVTLSATISINLDNVFNVGVMSAEEELGNRVDLDSTDTEQARFLRKYSLKLAQDINDVTQERVKEQIQTSLQHNETRQQMADRINTVINNPKRALMIAQTESIRAFASGRLAAGKRMGAQTKLWLTNGAIDEICVGAQEQGEVGIDDSFNNGLEGPPGHPNCRCYIKLSGFDPDEEE
jgi:hypothetical protein